METFSQETKNDLCAVFLKKRCCREAFLLGAMLPGWSEDRIVLSTENGGFAELYCLMAQSVFGCRPTKAPGGEWVIADRETLARIAAAGKEHGIPDGEALGFAGCEADKGAFLRGVFLACGTVTEPEADYHLELIPPDDACGRVLHTFLDEVGLPPKVLRRQGRKHDTLYYKDSEAMEDFLHFIGAHRSAFRLSDVKIVKELRNNSNRLANCDAANIGKAVQAAQGQLDAILLIAEKGRADELPPDLRETFDLRAAHPDLSLSELAALHRDKITKSGLSHRMARILRFAAKVRAEEEAAGSDGNA